MLVNRILVVFIVGLSVGLYNPFAFADSFTFDTTPPGGGLSGPAGATLGWGYTITNESFTNWLVTTALNAGSFLYGSPNALFDFPILSPGQTANVSYDALSGLGLYEFTWDAGALVGFTNNGVFTVSAEWWSGDPVAEGSFVITAAQDMTTPYSVTVTGGTQAQAPVPEPSTLLLVLGGIGLVWLAKSRGLNRRH